MGFSTKQIHAGVVARPRNRLDPHADLPVDDVRSRVGRSIPCRKASRTRAAATRRCSALEQKLAALENGAACTCYSTGMAAEQACSRPR